jgi:hypothetical protein
MVSPLQKEGKLILVLFLKLTPTTLTLAQKLDEVTALNVTSQDV